MSIHFNDGSKFDDLSKVWLFFLSSWEFTRLQQIIFVLQNILTATVDPEGYFLLQCLRRYSVLHAFTDLWVQTESHIQQGHEEAWKFSQYISVSELLPFSDYCNGCLGISEEGRGAIWHSGGKGLELPEISLSLPCLR